MMFKGEVMLIDKRKCDSVIMFRKGTVKLTLRTPDGILYQAFIEPKDLYYNELKKIKIGRTISIEAPKDTAEGYLDGEYMRIVKGE